LEDRRISAKSIAEQLGTSHELVGSIIHEDLEMLVGFFLPGRAKDLSANTSTHITKTPTELSKHPHVTKQVKTNTVQGTHQMK
jgi:hypothetical protein